MADSERVTSSSSRLPMRALTWLTSDLRRLWIAFGAVALLGRVVLGVWPRVAERTYHRVVYAALRLIIDNTVGLAPFPWLPVTVAAIMWLVVRETGRALERRCGASHNRIGTIIIDLLFSLGAWAGGLSGLFLVLWGYNYARPGFEEQTGIAPARMGVSELVEEAHIAAAEAQAARVALTDGDPNVNPVMTRTPGLEGRARGSLVEILDGLGLGTPGRPRVKRLWSGGAMLWMSTTGFYMPLSGEGYVSSDLLPLEEPFVVSHEMVHGYGLTDEGVANFLAWRACRQSGDPSMSYSGAIRYLATVLAHLRRGAPEIAAGVVQSISPEVVEDMAIVKANHLRFRRTTGQSLSRLAPKTNDLYLKAQGIAPGIGSYGQVVPLVVGWRMQERLKADVSGGGR